MEGESRPSRPRGATVSGTGGAAARRAAKGETPPPTPSAVDRRPGEVQFALEEQRDFLLASLRDLDREHAAGDIDDDDYAALKDDYTARAASVLRSIESRSAPRGQSAPARARRTTLWRTVAAVGFVAAVAAGSGIAVARSAGQRAPTGSVSGNSTQTVRDLLLLAQDQTSKQQVLDAVKTYDEVLRIDPGNVEALAYRAWLLRLAASQAAGENRQLLLDQALQYLDRALVASPGYADAHVFRAMVLADLGRPTDALADLDAIEPGSLPEYMGPTVEGLRQRLATAATPPGTR